MLQLLFLLVSGAAITYASSVTVKLVSLLLILGYWYLTRRPQGLPPGPRGIPLLGYIPFLRSNLHRQFNLIGKKYGPVSSLYIANQLTVILNDYDSIRQAFVDQGEDFHGRPINMPGMVFETDKRGFINSSGPQWREQRKFALTTLRNFGIGKSSMEPAIQNELFYFLQGIEARHGEPVDIATHISASLCNLICILEFGKRFEYNDPYFINLNKAISNYLHYMTSTGIYAVFPWLKYIPGANKIGNLDKVRYFGKILHDFGTKMMREHREVYVPGSKDDYINAHFTEAVERNRNGNYPELFDDVCLENNLRFLFIGGTETSTTTILWAILFMTLHPDVQRKVHAELDEVIGRQRLPCCADRPNLPYTEATLLEVHRRGSIVPLGVPRRTMQDVDLKGFTIPKDTTIIPNI